MIHAVDDHLYDLERQLACRIPHPLRDVVFRKVAVGGAAPRRGMKEKPTTDQRVAEYGTTRIPYQVVRRRLVDLIRVDQVEEAGLEMYHHILNTGLKITDIVQEDVSTKHSGHTSRRSRKSKASRAAS
ncbi:hypothetical protein ACFFLM_05335 [Deinococcus oregonensis]|uniref:Uncharacterized protein n=1 Tax=Deinococcus oregonensis TaxID=1805970 RepID=A0ABV6AV56_9DEIO